MTARPPLVALLAVVIAACALLLAPAALATSVEPADPLAALALQQARLLGGTPQDGEEFGFSVSLSGDTALVGAPYYGNANGRVYVFYRSSGVWTQHGDPLTGPSASAFGRSVALDGDTALVGAAAIDSAYVFTRTAGVWTQQGGALTGSDLSTFGWSVALDGDTALVGAINANAVYVFARSTGVWTQQGGALTGPYGSSFGFSVALDGDTAVVGAPGSMTAHVFTRAAGVWTQQGEPLTGNAGGYYFGLSVALDGNTALVGATGDALAPSSARADGGIYPGAAYVFTRRPVTFTLNQTGRGQSALVRYAPSASGGLVAEELWRGALDVAHAQLASGDLDGDGWADAAMLTQHGRETVLLAWLSTAPPGVLSTLWSGDAMPESRIACGDADGYRSYGSARRLDHPQNLHDEIWVYGRSGTQETLLLFSLVPPPPGPAAAPARVTVRRTHRAASLSSSATPQVACADADGDGRLELLVFSPGGLSRSRLSVWRPADAAFQTWWRGQIPAGARFAAGDANGDGLGDALVSVPDSRSPFALWLLPSRGSAFAGPRPWRSYRGPRGGLLALAAGDAGGKALADPAIALSQGAGGAALTLSLTDPEVVSGGLPLSYGYGLVCGLPVRLAVAPARATFVWK